MQQALLSVTEATNPVTENDSKMKTPNNPKQSNQQQKESSSSSDSQSSTSVKKKDKKKKHKRQGHNIASRHKHRSRSRSARKKSSRERHKQKDRKRKRSRSRDDRKKNRKEDKRRSRSKSKKSIEKKTPPPLINKPSKTEQQKKPQPLPLEIPMPAIPGERVRKRSRSPRSYYINKVNNDGEFWDSFSWQKKLNYTPNVSSADLINTKKMRRMKITNIPLEMGLTENDINQLVTKFMIKNYLNDTMNYCPIVNVQISEADRSVAIELSSVEETCRVCQLEKVELFKGNISRITRLGDSTYSGSIDTQAKAAAQAQAAAFAAVNVILNKSTNFNISNGMAMAQSSTVLRICNAVTQYMSQHCTPQQWKEHHDDLIDGFQPFGKIKHNWFVKPSQKMVGADPGNLFVQYETRDQAQKAMKVMQDRNYDQRNIKIYFIPQAIYEQHYKPQSGA